MQIEKQRSIIFSPIGATFIVASLCVFALGCSIFTVRPEIATEEAQATATITPKPAEEPENLLDGLLAIEETRQNPGSESNQTLQSYLATVASSKSEIIHNNVNSVAFSPNGKWIVSGSLDGTTRVWDVTVGQAIASLTVDGAVMDVDFSPDGKLVAQGACEGFSKGVVACGEAIVRIWEVNTGKEIFKLEPDYAITAVKFTPDGKSIATAGGLQRIQLWDLQSGKLLAMFYPDFTGAEKLGQLGLYISAIDIDPLGKLIVVANTVVVQVWDLKTGQEVSKYPQGAASVAFSPDGELVASASKDIRIWDAKTGMEVATRISVDGYDVKFSADGKWLAVASGTMVRVWEFPSEREVSQISLSSGAKSIAFSPDGKWIASGGYDNTVSVSLWNSDDLIAEICSLLPRNFTHNEWKQNFGDAPYRPTCANLPVPTN